MSTTPPPQAQAPPTPQPDGPAHALHVARSFVKQYYKMLSDNPDSVRNFYHPDSQVQHVGTSAGDDESKSAVSHLFADLPDDAFSWAYPIKASEEDGGDDDDVLAIDLTGPEARIDAQNSVNGAILLVTAGHMHLPGSTSVVADRPFVHTIVLANSAPAGRKKQYYVHNDVLRVMKAEKESSSSSADADAEATTEAKEAATTSTKSSSKAAKKEATAPALVEEAAATTEDEAKEASAPAPQAADEVPTDDDANGKTSTTDKEAKDEAPAQDPSANSAAASAESTPKSADKKKSKKSTGRNSRGASRSSSPTNGAAKNGEDDLKAAAEAAAAAVSAPKVPESWASRVKTSGPPSVPPSPARDTAAAKKGKKQGGGKDDDAKKNGGAGGSGGDGGAPASSTSDDRGNGSKDNTKSGGKRPPAAPRGGTTSEPPGRNPDATIIIRNVPGKTTNADLHGLFHSYAERHRCPIRVVSILPGRSIAYIDFDDPEGVAAIMRDMVGQEPWKMHGNVLEVKRKSDDMRAGGSQGKGGVGGGGNRNRHRSASPGTGHQKSGGSGGGGGGKGYRKPSPRHQRPGASGGGGGGGSRSGGGK